MPAVRAAGAAGRFSSWYGQGLMAGDVHFVTSWLAVGGAISNEADVRDILVRGVTHVINCRFTDDSRLLGGRTSYLWNPAADDGKPKAPNWFLRAVRFALCAHQDPGSKILVHCAGGAHRSPAIAYAILRARGSSPEEAESAIVTAQPTAAFPYRDSADAALLQFDAVREMGRCG